MPSYTVTSVEKAEVWSNEYGQFQAWNIQLREGQREPENATTNTKLGNDFVAIGETVEGELSNGRFKRAKPASGGGGASSGNGYKRDPKETASIVRQHSQTAAVYYAAILQKAHPDIDPHYDWLRGIIDWFFEDAMRAAGR